MKFTKEEIEVSRLINKRMSDAQIARKLKIKIEDVKNRKDSIIDKLCKGVEFSELEKLIPSLSKK